MRSPKPFRRLGRILLAAVAMILIVEEWLWDHLRAVLDAALAKLPLARLKAAVKDFILERSPYESLVLFAFPVVALVPLKVFGLWLFASGHWFLGMGNFLLAKLAGTALTAVLFRLTKPKLLSLPWFCSLFGTVMAWIAWAHRRLEPSKERIRRIHRRVRKRIQYLQAKVQGGLGSGDGRGSTALFCRFIRRAKFRSSKAPSRRR